MGSGRCWLPGGGTSRSAGGGVVVWGSGLAAGGRSNGGEAEEEVASGVVGVWEQGVGELGLVGGGPVSAGRSWRALGDAGAWRGVFKVRRGSSGGLGERIGCRWLVEWW